MLAHSLIGNRHNMRKYRETSRALKHKEKIDLKLGLEKCGNNLQLFSLV